MSEDEILEKYQCLCCGYKTLDSRGEFDEMKRFNYLLGEIEAVYHEVFFKLGLSDSAAKILYTICDEGDGCLLREVRRH